MSGESNDWSGERVLVVGLRMTGSAVARSFLSRGAEVTVVEERPGALGYAELRDELIAAGAQIIEAPEESEWRSLVAGVGLVVPSPGVAPSHAVMIAALNQGVPVRGDIDLAVGESSVPVVAVTGTNGKTTVTTLIAAMLEANGVRAGAAGNIGWAVMDAQQRAFDVLVVEVSSFQLHSTTEAFSPSVSVLLNIAEDHTDWHGSFGEYSQDKAQVFRHQGPADLLVYNSDDPIVASLALEAPGRTLSFSIDPGATSGYRIHNGALVTPDGDRIARIADLPLQAPHDLANALAASAAALNSGANIESVHAALLSFARLHHRAEPIGENQGVSFINDSKATNPHATITAVGGYESCVLIAGGRNKGIDLSILRPLSKKLRGVVAIGECAAEIEAAFEGTTQTRVATTMKDAVRFAAEMSKPGDVVLLSPACASFDWYRSYEERGDSFVSEVEAFIAGASQ